MRAFILRAIYLLLVFSILLPGTSASSTLQNLSTALENTYTISGRVTDSNGNPAPGVTVQATLSTEKIYLPLVFRGSVQADSPPTRAGMVIEGHT